MEWFEPPDSPINESEVCLNFCTPSQTGIGFLIPALRSDTPRAM